MIKIVPAENAIPNEVFLARLNHSIKKFTKQVSAALVNFYAFIFSYTSTGNT